MSLLVACVTVQYHYTTPQSTTLALQAFLLSSPTTREVSKSQAVQIESQQHQVEIYYYYDKENRLVDKAGTWDDFPATANLMLLGDKQLVVAQQQTVSIDGAHSQGILHRGVWVAVLRPWPSRVAKPPKDHSRHQQLQQQQQVLTRPKHEYQILFLQRSPALKTCGGSWSLMGEHCNPGETWRETVQRGLLEELHLGTSSARQEGKQDYTTINLFPKQSVLVRTRYGQVNRRELQATALFAVILSPDQQRLEPDDEVAAWKWVALDELMHGTFCNAEITQLSHLVGRRLVELGYS